MKKQLIYLIALIIVTTQAYSAVQASNYSNGSVVAGAIKKYKAGNYTGCMQDMQLVAKKDPSNSVAYYYMAISYVQAGKRTEAIDAYSKVMSLNTNPTLYKYANQGKTCLETPEKCKAEDLTDLDKAVNEPFGDGLSDKVRADLEQQRLDALKNNINSGKEIDGYDTLKLKDYSNQRSDIKTEDKIATQAQPSNDEIVAALRVLNRAGLNPYAQATTNPYAQANGAQSAEFAQISSLLGSSNQGNNNNNMMNMIPFMLAQKNEAGGANSYSPQLMQAMMMNSMLPDFSIDTDKDK